MSDRLLVFLCVATTCVSLVTSKPKAQTLGEAIETARGQDTEDVIKNGGSVHAGQFGDTIYQYKDHYKSCYGLSCAINPGQWAPFPTATHALSKPGLLGEIIFDPRGFPRWMWDGERWIDQGDKAP